LNGPPKDHGIAAESREFLVWLFSDLRDDLVHQADVEGPVVPDPETVARNTAIFDSLLAGLRENHTLPDTDDVREYVEELAKATDKSNEYERVAREHRALTELRNLLLTEIKNNSK
jgi:hypothetical protein